LRTRQLLAVVFLLGALATCVAPPLAHAQAQTYYVISLDGAIDPGTQNYVASAIGDAQSAGAGHIVMVLDTAGGDAQSMDGIIQAISSYESSGGTFVTVVGPHAAEAISAGAFIAEASDQLYMMNGTTLGSASAVVATTLTNSTYAYTAYMQALASYYGRNGTAAGLMVSGDASFSASQADRVHAIDGLINASSVSDALSQLGVPSSAPISDEGISSQLISVLSDPNLAAVLFLAGILAIMVDLYHPTFILSAAGAAAIVLALIGLGYFGAPLSAVLLMFIGGAFIFLEVKTHHGVSAIGGVVVFAIGVLLVFQNTVTPSPTSTGITPPPSVVGANPATYAILGLLGVAIIIGSIYLYRLRRDLDSRKLGLFEMKRMVGRVGVLTSDVRANATGTANIDSEDWTVTSSQDLPKGARVKVKEIQGYKLLVEGISA